MDKLSSVRAREVESQSFNSNAVASSEFNRRFRVLQSRCAHTKGNRMRNVSRTRRPDESSLSDSAAHDGMVHRLSHRARKIHTARESDNHDGMGAASRG